MGWPANERAPSYIRPVEYAAWPDPRIRGGDQIRGIPRALDILELADAIHSVGRTD